MPGVAARSVTRRGGHAADPEERVDLAVLDRIDGLGGSEALLLDVLLAVEAGRLQHAKGHDLRPAASRSRRHAFALEIGQAVDARALDGHHVHLVGIEHHQRPGVDLAVLELVDALVGLPPGVGHDESHLRLAGIDELQVVDGAAGHFGGGRQPGNVLGQDVGHAATHRIIDATGASGRDRYPGRLLRERKWSERERGDGARDGGEPCQG